MPWSLFDRQEQKTTGDTYRIILEGTPAMLWLGDHGGKCVYLNKAQREFWGVRIEDIPEFDWSRTLHPDDIPHLRKIFSAAMQDQKGFEAEARYMSSDGSFRILHTRANPRLSSTGEFLGMIGVNTDVTDQRAAERRVTLLKNELAHRIKNLFTVARAIVSITERESPDAADALASLRRRFDALGIAYAETMALGDGQNQRRLSQLADLVLAPFSEQIGRITTAGLDIPLSQQATASLALILNELATNSAKYGCLSGIGALHLSAEPAPEKKLAIIWREDGVPVTKGMGDSNAGFGSQLLTCAAMDLGATVIAGREDGAFVVRLVAAVKALSPRCDSATDAARSDEWESPGAPRTGSASVSDLSRRSGI